MLSAIRGVGILWVLSLYVLFSFLVGCAPKAYVSTIGGFEGVSSVCLKKVGETKNKLMDSFVERTLAEALKRKGVEISEKCENTLEYSYGVVPKQMYVPRIVYGGAEVYTIVGYRLEGGRAVPEIFTFLPPPPAYYYTDVETVYRHYLTLGLKKGETLLWMGEISKESDSPDIRSEIRVLAEKLLDFFGKDTGRMIEIEVR